MAILELNSTQMEDGFRGRPLDDHGKVRFQRFDVPAVVAAGDAGTIIELCQLPPGAVRVVPAMSRFEISALGAARTMDIGHRAYMTRPSPNTLQAEDLDAIVANIDVSSALAGVVIDTSTKFDLYSLAGVTITAQINDGTLPIGATLSGYIAYLYE